MRTLAPLGELSCTVLTFETFTMETWESHPVAVPLFLGQPFPFIIDVELEDGSYPADVTEAIERFLALGLEDREVMTTRAYINYLGQCQVAIFDMEEIGRDRVWEFAEVKSISVERTYHTKKVFVRVSCKCEWEEEHGMQLVYWQGTRLILVGTEDTHVHDPKPTDGDDAQDNFPTACFNSDGTITFPHSQPSEPGEPLA